jgi:WD40-like Beta Propeller Repeat
LTGNVPGSVATSGAVSPDGKYLAHSQLEGLRLQLLATGDTRTIPQPDVLKGGEFWVVGPWLPDATRFVANLRLPGGRWSVWLVSVLGDTPRKLRDNGFASGVDPVASRTVYKTGGQSGQGTYNEPWFSEEEVWSMDPDGGNPQKIFQSDDSRTWFSRMQYSAAGGPLAYLKKKARNDSGDSFEQSIQVRTGANAAITVVTNPGLEDFCWVAAGRIVYAASDPEGQSDNLWEIIVDPRSGIPQADRHRLTNWAGFHFDDLSASSDGKMLTFHRWNVQSTVYVADFDRKLKSLKNLRRLTFADADETPSAWTRDSNAVIFISDRLGHHSVYKQELGGSNIDLLASGKEGTEIWEPRLSPDGSWIVYHEVHPSANDPADVASLPSKITRVRSDGGSPEFVFSSTYHGLRCTRAADGFCVNAEFSSDGRQIVFVSFDPLKGKGHELTHYRLDSNDRHPTYLWDISPDGNNLALVIMRRETRNLFSLEVLKQRS